MFSQDPTGLPPPWEVDRFFRLLADIGRIQQGLLEETRILRARVLELETLAKLQADDPGHRQGRPS
jgi:hypothetical protein